MNGIIIDKDLCHIGGEIDNRLNELLEQQRRDPTSRRGNKIYSALKEYFNHRRECLTCKVKIWIRESNL